MCHSDNIYGDKHKKTVGCSQTTITSYIISGCKPNVFYVYRPIGGKVQLAAPIKGFAYNRVFYRFLSKPCHIFTKHFSPINCDLHRPPQHYV